MATCPPPPPQDTTTTPPKYIIDRIFPDWPSSATLHEPGPHIVDNVTEDINEVVDQCSEEIERHTCPTPPREPTLKELINELCVLVHTDNTHWRRVRQNRRYEQVLPEVWDKLSKSRRKRKNREYQRAYRKKANTRSLKHSNSSQDFDNLLSDIFDSIDN